MLSLYSDEIIKRENELQEIEELNKYKQNQLLNNFIKSERYHLNRLKEDYRKDNKEKFNKYYTESILDTIVNGLQSDYTIEQLQEAGSLKDLAPQKNISIIK